MQEIHTGKEAEKPGLYQKPNMPNMNQLRAQAWKKEKSKSVPILL
jgi:hypothetical protein